MMKKSYKLLSVALLSATLAACSDSDSKKKPADAGVLTPADGTPVTTPNDPSSVPAAVPVQPGTEQPVTEQPVTVPPVTEQPVTEQPVTEQPVTEQPEPGNANGAPYPLIPMARIPTPGLGAPQVPELADPSAARLPSPASDDPFGFGLEYDGEGVSAGGPPTQPKNLRAELISNNWAELNWAPSNDDGTVVQYKISRDDGVTFIIRGDQTDENASAQDEINKFWVTTSFIDCNFTRFDQRLHGCGKPGVQPVPGQTYIYYVTAMDNDGQESAASEPLSITYLAEKNAPVPRYDDLFKSVDDTFVQDNDLSAIDHFFDDEFELVFQDEFNGDSLDPRKWQTQLTWGDETIINRENQYFVHTQRDPDFGYDPFKFTGESLIIEAIPVPEELRPNLPQGCITAEQPGYDPCEFLSGALSTFDRFNFLYGLVEGRFKVSDAPGALSSFYLYHRYKGDGTSFHAPEIDILEYLGENQFGDELAFQTYHYESPRPGGGESIFRSVPTMGTEKPDGGTYGGSGEWHTFSVLWEPQLVVWYIDGVEVKRLFGPQISRRPMNIVNYLVAGSAWAPFPDASDESIFPMQFETDYIRVYQRSIFKNAGYGPVQ